LWTASIPAADGQIDRGHVISRAVPWGSNGKSARRPLFSPSFRVLPEQQDAPFAPKSFTFRKTWYPGPANGATPWCLISASQYAAGGGAGAGRLTG
jgi:hypothetical protein